MTRRARPHNRGFTAEQRGYDSAHRSPRRRLARTVAAGRATCWRCGLLVLPGSSWDLGHHDIDRSRHMGPEHRSCNRSAAAEKRRRMYGSQFRSQQPRRRTPTVNRQTATRRTPPALQFFNTSRSRKQ
jgi:hypothetical protein